MECLLLLSLVRYLHVGKPHMHSTDTKLSGDPSYCLNARGISLINDKAVFLSWQFSYVLQYGWCSFVLSTTQNLTLTMAHCRHQCHHISSIRLKKRLKPFHYSLKKPCRWVRMLNFCHTAWPIHIVVVHSKVHLYREHVSYQQSLYLMLYHRLICFNRQSFWRCKAAELQS